MVDEGLEHLLVVEERVDQVGVILDLVDKAGVDNLQDHPQRLL